MIPQDAIHHRIAFDPKPFCAEDGALRVLLVFKKSRLEVYASQYPELNLDEATSVREHEEHSDCLDQTIKSLLARGAHIEFCYRGDLTREKTLRRIIVTVGGDGTILDASHFTDFSPIFGVNSDPKSSVGSLCIANSSNFDELFDKLQANQLPVLPVARIGGTLDGKELPVFALNDILVAHQNPAAMSRYTIEVDGQKEEHKSSGIWIAAPIGSTGATLSAGGHLQALNDTRIQLVVREPYFSIGKVTKLLSGLVHAEQVLKLTSRMPGGQIFFDGPHCFERFALGSELELHSRGRPLSLFVTDEMEARRLQMAKLRETFHDQMVKEHPEFVA